jgi:ABC-2 type transport system permease protein
MLRLINSELFKMRKRSMTWILLYILVGFIVIFHLLLFAISRISLPSIGRGGGFSIQDFLGLSAAIPFALYTLSSLGSLLAVILVASATGNEYNWRTIRIALISSESRFKFLAAKLVSVIIIILIGMLIGIITGFVVGLITAAIGGSGFDFSFASGHYFWSQFLQFCRTFFIIMLYTFLGFLFAVVGRSAMPGIAVGVGILFIEPIITSLMSLAGGWVAKIPNYLLAYNVRAINSSNDLSSISNSGFSTMLLQLPSASQAFIVLTVYMVMFVVLTFYLFHKRDVTG